MYYRPFCNCKNSSGKKAWTDFAKTANSDKIIAVSAEVEWDCPGQDVVDCSPVFDKAAEIFGVDTDDIFLAGFDPQEFPDSTPFENIGVYCVDCGGWL